MNIDKICTYTYVKFIKLYQIPFNAIFIINTMYTYLSFSIEVERFFKFYD